ncbi:MAG TPA: M23 family metallopeptidase [Gemmatimonadales bacterium]|jgi:murein DD-endopeptidase MepM/ murein hydrolase activator NlpD|nr:M23 family metallopeptidase [Gemmatimonadales bacterium]
MARKRRWTLVLVPHDSEPSRIIEVSYSLLKLGAATVVIVVAASLLFGYANLSHSIDLSRADRLERENRALAAELGDLHGRLHHLSDTVTALSQRDEQIRLLANLDPIAPEVREAGIGGPVEPKRGAPEPSGVLIRRADEIKVDLSGMIRRANLLATSFNEAADSLASHKERIEAMPSILPTQGWLTSNFSLSRMHPVLGFARPHEGIDVAAPTGTPIEAPAAGRVVEVGWESGYGNVVVLDHGYGIETKFAHTSKVLVRTGQRVKRGDRIALVGSTGLATGPHLHYEVHVNGRPVNPLRYVLPEVVAD